MNLRLQISLLFIFTVTLGYTQVGINTTNPQAALDVNGTLRVGKLNSQDFQAVRLLGVTEEGIIMELNMDDNIYIDGDTVKANVKRASIFDMPVIDLNALDNAPSIVWPGGAGGRSTIKITNLSGDLQLTGIDVSPFATPLDAHGYMVSLYSVSGNIQLLNQDAGSNPENQFALGTGVINIRQYEVVQLMYDGVLEKWILVL